MLPTSENLLIKNIKGERIENFEILEALLKEYEKGLDDGVDIIKNQIALIQKAKKGS